MADNRPDYSTIRTTAGKAIRLKCLDCAGSSNEVLLCAIRKCPLWRFRRGKEERDELYAQAHPKSQLPPIVGVGEVETASDDDSECED